MSFKLNDYYCFLSSLYEDRGNEGEGKFPIDFNFGLAPGNEVRPAENPPLDSGLSPNAGSVSSPDIPNMPRDSKSNNNKKKYVPILPSSGSWNSPDLSTNKSHDELNDQDRRNEENEIDRSKENNKLSVSSFGMPAVENSRNYHSNFDPFGSTIERETHRFKSPDEGLPELSEDEEKSLELFPFLDVAPRHTSSSKISKEKFIRGSDNTDNNESYEPRIRSSHNVIEQRYRNKINDKFAALKESVPTLRTKSKRKPSESSGQEESHLSNNKLGELSLSDSEALEGLEPARKLNKGTILTKSVEYIKFLELKNSRMRAQQEELIEKAKLLGIPIEDISPRS